jgi:multidrug efflux pump subunit AcrB
MWVWLITNKLSNLGLTVNEITTSIKNQYLLAALGSIGAW